MSIAQSLKEQIAHYLDQIKIFIFGENNVRIDKLIDRFYSMRAEKRSRVKFAMATCVTFLCVGVLFLYGYGLWSLQNKLNRATYAYLKIEEYKPIFTLVQNEYTKLASSIETVNETQNLIPEIQKVASALGLNIDGFSGEMPVVVDLPSTSILFDQFKIAKINLKITGVSLKKLIDFLNNIHTLPNKFTLTNLEIIQIFGNKLYFNAIISLEAYVPKLQKG